MVLVLLVIGVGRDNINERYYTSVLTTTVNATSLEPKANGSNNPHSNDDEFSFLTCLKDVLDNLPEQLVNVNINPLSVSKSKLIRYFTYYMIKVGNKDVVKAIGDALQKEEKLTI